MHVCIHACVCLRHKRSHTVGFLELKTTRCHSSPAYLFSFSHVYFWICSLQFFSFCFSIWWCCGWITSTAWKFVTQCHNPNIAQDAGASSHLRSGFCGMVNCPSQVCTLNGIDIRFSESLKWNKDSVELSESRAVTFKKFINWHDGF